MIKAPTPTESLYVWLQLDLKNDLGLKIPTVEYTFTCSYITFKQ